MGKIIEFPVDKKLGDKLKKLREKFCRNLDRIYIS